MVEVLLSVDACKGSFGLGGFSLGSGAVQLRSRRLRSSFSYLHVLFPVELRGAWLCISIFFRCL